MNLSVVTSGDKNYFKFLWRFERNIFKQFGEYPVIYDLGLLKSQRKKLKSKIVKIDVEDSFSGYTTDGFIKAVHKPLCVAHFLSTNNQAALFLDADMLFKRKIDKEDLSFIQHDLAFTPRHETERYAELYKNGHINSGILYFNNNKRVKDFVNLWIEEAKKPNTSDQLALSNLLTYDGKDLYDLVDQSVSIKGAETKFLNPAKYNDVSLTDGLILHYKNAARKPKSYQRYKVEYQIINWSLPLRKAYRLYLKILRKFNLSSKEK